MSSKITDDDIGKRLWEMAKAQALGTAELAGPAPGQKQFTPDEVATLFWQEEKGWTVEKEMALLAEGKTPRQVGALKYPHRMKLASSGGRALSKYAQSKWMADTAKKLDPTWSPTPPAGSQMPTAEGYADGTSGSTPAVPGGTPGGPSTALEGTSVGTGTVRGQYASLPTTPFSEIGG